MKTVLAILFAGVLGASAATITGNLLDCTGNTNDARVRFIPRKTLLQGTNVVVASARGIQTTNGGFALALFGGWYDVDFGDPDLRYLRILVPLSNTNSFTLRQVADLAVNADRFDGTNIVVNIGGGGGSNGISVAAGARMTASTNDALVTLSSDLQTMLTNGFPWGVLYDPAGAASAATNGLGSAARRSDSEFVLLDDGTATNLSVYPEAMGPALRVHGDLQAASLTLSEGSKQLDVGGGDVTGAAMVEAVTFLGAFVGNGSGVTNMAPASLNWGGITTGAFTNVVAGRLSITNGGTVYYITLSTNAP